MPAGWGDDGTVGYSWVQTMPIALAGFWRRLGSSLLDGILISIIAIPFGGTLAFTGDTSTAEAAARTTQSTGFQSLLQIIYFTYLHSTAAGQSVGNLATSVRVADIDTGQPLPWSRALIRVLMSFVSAIPLGLGFFWMLWDANNQTWHDKVARSVVVKTDRSPTPGPFGRPASSG